MTRISTYGSGQLYLSRIMTTQERMHLSQVQVSTGKISQNFSGIAADATRAINLENEKSQQGQFKKNNAVANTRLQAMDTALTSIRKTIVEFKNNLLDFDAHDTTDPQRIKSVQDWAWRALQDMQTYLGTNVDGQYLFAGGRTNTEPMQLSSATLAEFQSKFDGFDRTVPTTRDTMLAAVSLDSKRMGAVSFVASDGVVIPGRAEAFNAIRTQSFLSIGGTTDNDASVTIRSHAPTNVAGGLAGAPAALREGTATTAFINYGSSATLINHATSGDLTMEFAADGSMTMEPANAGTLAALTAGTKFSIGGETAYNGSFVVKSNSNGIVTFVNDTEVAKTELVAASALTVTGIGATGTAGTAATLGSGNATFSTSSNSVTLHLPTGTTLPAGEFDVGDNFSIAGSTYHNGSFKVTGVDVSSAGTNITFAVNPDAVRVGKFLPQGVAGVSGRSDVTLTYTAGESTAQFVSQTGRNDVTMTYNSGLSTLDFDNEPTTLSFVRSNTGEESIEASTTDAFLVNGVAEPAAGAEFTVTSTSGVNDGTYRVTSNTGTKIVIERITTAGEHTWVPADYGTLTFAPTGGGGETIHSNTAGAFLDEDGVGQPKAGTTFRLSSDSHVNDGVYQVLSNDGTDIVIVSTTVADETATSATITSEQWFKGDNLTLQHRVTENRSIDVGIYASDPGFEKAIRAMQLIAQGVTGTAGGLENNQDRIADAMYLLRDAIDSSGAGAPPFGAEAVGSLDSLTAHVQVMQYTIKNTNANFDLFTQFIDQRIIDIENVDKTEAITRLLDDKTALEASYQALGRIRELSLMSYLK